MSTSQKSKDSTPSNAGKIAIRPKTVAFALLGLAAIGLTIWGMASDSSETGDDLAADVDWADGMKSPLGAVGVSDSAAPASSESMPLVLPNVTPDGLATASTSDRNTGLTGPLFNESISTSQPSRQGVSTAGFERPVDAARPATGAPRVTANQPVWLTGNIEPAPTQSRVAVK